MKNTICLSSLLFLLFALLPQTGYSAIAKPQTTEVTNENGKQFAEGKTTKLSSVKERLGQWISKFKQKLRKWKDWAAIKLPTGKLLASIVFLVVGIVLFAVASNVIYDTLFSVLGSVAVIGAIVLFVLWLLERMRATTPTPSD